MYVLYITHHCQWTGTEAHVHMTSLSANAPGFGLTETTVLHVLTVYRTIPVSTRTTCYVIQVCTTCTYASLPC